MAIDIDLDESQQALRAAARSLFERAGGPTLARALMEDDTGYSTDLWARMAELDWVGLAVPEVHGGSGGSLLDLYALYLEMGRALVTSPHLPSSVIAAHVLATAGSAAQRSTLLPGMARGDTLVVPAVLEASGVWDEGGVGLRVGRDGTDVRLDGTKVLVPFAHVADRLLVAGRDDEGVTLVLVDPAAPGVGRERLDNLAGLALFAVTFDGVVASIDDRVGPAGGGWAVLAPALARGSLLRCAEIAGAGEAMLELAVSYAHERVQFGSPIGRYQAVQYLCTDIAIESHLTGLLSRRAAWLVDQGLAADREVAAATLYASRAAHHMAQQAHEVFAGVAFMMEHDLHLFTRHAKHWEHDLGDARHHAEALVRALEARP